MSQGKNEFYKGLDMDTDPHKIESECMRDASNIRIVDNEGDGLVAVNINGNEIRFSLKPNYVPLGYCVFNSIAYIFSTDTTNPGQGEIGCYPAPNGVGGFLTDINGNPVYKALQNWTGNLPGNPRQDFNTSLFNFSQLHQIQAVARIDYDNSVNLYWCDFNNQDRVVNSGFDQTGTYNNRTYYTGNFNQISIFSNTPFHPIITGMSEQTGGQLLCGNYFAFIRYVTVSLNRTDFLCQSNAIQISLEPTYDMEVDGAPGLTQSQKQVTLNLSNLDPSYMYFEIAMVYYNQGTATTYLINKLYSIADAITSGNVVITGTEGQTTFTFAQITTSKSSFNTSKSIAQLENRLWRANVKESNQLTPDMITFANNVKISWDDSLTIPDAPMNTGETLAPGPNQNGQYKYYENTYNDVGYFRGETYPFALVFVFTDGTESEAIQCSGKDDWANPAIPLRPNPQGIYRFPNAQVSPFRTSSVPVPPFNNGVGVLNIMGVKFDWTGLTIPLGVIGWYFVRAKRTQNLIYQGIVLPTFKANTNSPTAVSNPYPNINLGDFSPFLYTGAEPYYNNPNSIPLLDYYVPMFFKDTPIAGPGLPGGRNIIEYQQGEVQVEDTTRKGFYGSDYFFSQTIENQPYSIYNIATVSMPNINFDFNGNLSAQSPNHAIAFMFETVDMNFGVFGPISGGVASCVNIPGFSSSPPIGDQFVSQFDNGSNATNTNAFIIVNGSDILLGKTTYYNREFATNSYIGIHGSDTQFPWDNGTVSNINYNHYVISNIYSNNPDPGSYNILNIYSLTGLLYEKISNLVMSSQIATNQICYNGDCFLQRTYLKQLYNKDTVDNDNSNDGRSINAADGIIFSIVTENNINSAMRGEDATNLYYPKTGLNNGLNSQQFYAFATADNKPEADQINTGYDQILSGFTYEGFDPTLPFQENTYPTRIMYSEFHPNGSFEDFYLIFDFAAYQDYDYRLGYIVDILAFHSRLVSIQQSGINFHLVNERALLSQGASAGQLEIGTGDILSPKANIVSDVYGSQHQWSIVQTDYNIYGIDYNKRKIWRVKPSGEFENISDTKKVKNWINNVFKPVINPESTIINTLPDNPVNVTVGGLVTGYDRKYGDVIFTLVQQSRETIDGVNFFVLNADSMCFSEIMDEFTNRPQYNSPFYISLNNDFFSINYNSEKDFYLHDIETTIGGAPNRQTFYTVLQKSFIEWIHNENSDFEKIYEHLEILSYGEDYSNIIYNTEDQVANNTTFRQSEATMRYLDPRFRENKWLVPVSRATSINGTVRNPNQIESVMRGTYMKVYLEFKQAVKQFTKSVLTSWRRSY